MSVEGATPPQAEDAARQIVDALNDMYAAFLAADWDRFNKHVDPNLTAWESHLPNMIHGQDQLDSYRHNRPTPKKLGYLTASQHIFDTWDSTTLVRYILTGASESDPDEVRRSRVTEVFRWNGDSWRIAHRHSERMSDAGS
jgi:hypothetical protein